MQIRPGVESDIPAIVELVKMSLGEDTTIKTESYWRWKHVDNPFGQSPVLLGFEGDQLVGIRAFMRWRWTNGEKIYESVRAVDTATHPDFRGKGTFKKLTMALLEKCKDNGWDFVFNTPNKISKPGYLKMGWTIAGRLPLTVNINHPLNVIMNFARRAKSASETYPNGNIKEFLNKPGLAELLIKSRDHFNGNLITAHSVESLLWRYDKVTVKQYFACGLEENNRLVALIFYRLKPGRAGNELRITDIFAEHRRLKNAINALVRDRVRLHNPDFVTVDSMNPWFSNALLLGLRGMPFGPVVTIRGISEKFDDTLHDFKKWRPSVGDLELF